MSPHRLALALALSLSACASSSTPAPGPAAVVGRADPADCQVAVRFFRSIGPELRRQGASLQGQPDPDEAEKVGILIETRGNEAAALPVNDPGLKGDLQAIGGLFVQMGQGLRAVADLARKNDGPGVQKRIEQLGALRPGLNQHLGQLKQRCKR